MENTFAYFYFKERSETVSCSESSHQHFIANMLYMKNKTGKVSCHYPYGEASAHS